MTPGKVVRYTIPVMANYKIEDVQGIGPVFGEKLRDAGVTDTEGLLASCQTRSQRAFLSTATGLSEGQILKFANMADLYRISGVGQQFSELLEASGVDTIPDLASRNSTSLTETLTAVNAEKFLTRRVPTEQEVAEWIEQAKQLPRALEY